ncbi:MAG: S8 family serine peptidase, partial [Pirellulales bacterium]
MSHSTQRPAHSTQSPRGLTLESVEPRLLFAADSVDAAASSLSTAGNMQVELPAALSTASMGGDVSTSVSTTNYGFTGAGQTVVIIDSGIAWDHSALGGGIGAGQHIVGGWDFAENDADPYDDGPMGTHGTHVAGIIGSLDPRYPGLSPGADIVALRVFDDQGQGDFPRIEAALRWVHDHLNSFANPITTVNLSVGARWNAEGAPEWSIIEDELATLEADGVFIAVAAGNSFANYDQQVGLAYPAASSHVVPVASVDANGMLSSFSQRSDRVLAAPGRNVMSTVPDYAGNFNYRADDFLTLSGTSMAAPHVAAASMLVREALAAAGRTRVTQADIYAVLRDTADVVFDTITGQDYRRLNIERALGSIEIVPTPTPIPTPTPTPADPSPGSPAPSVVDWGVVDSAVFAGQSFSGQAWRKMSAANDGILTIEFAAAASGGSAKLFDATGTLVAVATPTGSGLRLDASVVAGQAYRVQISAAGEGIDVRVTNLVRRDGMAVYVLGTSGDDAFAFTAGGVYNGLSHEVIVNGTRYTFDTGTTRRVYLLGGDGQDTVTLVGTNGFDAATLRPGKVSLRTTTVLALARGFETATIDGRGGRDVAYFGDSQADETFTAWGDRVELVGGASLLRAVDFESVRARSFAGQDTATLHASDATDQVSRVGPSTRLIGASVLREVTGFDTVSTFAALSVQFASAAAESFSLHVSADASKIVAPAPAHD